MKVNKFNVFMGYFMHVLGVFKMIAIVIAMLYALSVLPSVMQGNDTFYNQQLAKTEIIGIILGGAHVFAFVASVVMIFVNSKDNIDMIPGYGMAIGAVLLSVFLEHIPFIIRIVFYTGECILYTKAGNKILNAKSSKSIGRKNTAQEIKETDWFYDQEYKGNERLNKISEENKKKETKIKKIESEILEWDKMFEQNQIDEESYKVEVASLKHKIEKIRN